MDEFLTPDFLKFFIPLSGAVVGWFLNERRKRRWDEYLRKEERYRVLIAALRGFYVETHDTQQKDLFIRELNQCWLYCPDEVIERGYQFLDTIRFGNRPTDEEKEATVGAFALAIRKDLLSRRLVRRTRFTAKSFKHLRAT